MPDYALYHLQVTTLTPLHIGTGVKLLHEYDYAIHGGKTWRIDEAAFLDSQDADDPELVEKLANTPPARLLQDSDFIPGSDFFRYAIQGTPRSRAEGAQLQEYLKNPEDWPYLPGSSLKGALRTALGWHAWKALDLKPEMGRMGRAAKWAAQGYEHEIFGDDPNHDSMRVLQVADSAPVSPDRLMVLNARVLGRGGQMNSPIELEAIRPETVFEIDLKLDMALFSDWARRHRLNLGGEGWVSALPAIANTRTLSRARREAQWFSTISNATRLRDFYQQLARIQPQDNQFILQLGWGTGWEDKTFGDRLSSDTAFFQQAVTEYRLSRGKGGQGSVFPSSRRVAAAFRRDAQDNVIETPAYPLGWVLVTFESTRGPQVWKTSRAAAEPVADPTPAPRPASGPAAPAPVLRPPAQSAPQPAPRAASPLIRRFSGPPEPGQRFAGTVLEVEKGLVSIELPGLSVDDWMGQAALPVWKIKDRVNCEVTGVEPDPRVQGSWIVNCRILE